MSFFSRVWSCVKLQVQSLWSFNIQLHQCSDNTGYSSACQDLHGHVIEPYCCGHHPASLPGLPPFSQPSALPLGAAELCQSFLPAPELTGPGWTWCGAGGVPEELLEGPSRWAVDMGHHGAGQQSSLPAVFQVWKWCIGLETWPPR